MNESPLFLLDPNQHAGQCAPATRDVFLYEYAEVSSIKSPAFFI
jgi:hypothetical protein